MSNTLSIHGQEVQSLDDIYLAVESYLDGRWVVLYSRNLDALYDVLSEVSLEKIVIHEKRKLKHTLEQNHDESDEMSDYYRLLSVFSDLDGVDIVLED